MLSDVQRRNAIARLLRGDTKPADEAQRLGVKVRTIYRWLEDAKAASPELRDDTKDSDRNVSHETSQNVTPPGNDAEKGHNPALKAALDAAGETSGTADTPGAGPGAIYCDPGQARRDMEEFCLEAYSGLKASTGSTLVQWNYSPPLEVDSPDVQKLLKVGKVATTAIRTNAPRLYPLLVKYMSGWAPLILALGADSVGMMLGLGALAKSKGWTPAKKKETDEARKKEKLIDLAEMRELQQQQDDARAQAGALDVGNDSKQLNAPRPDAA